MKRAFRMLGVALQEYQLVRRLAVVWACSLITYATLRVFESPQQITEHMVDALQLLTGLLGVLIGGYGLGRYLEKRRGRQ